MAALAAAVTLAQAELGETPAEFETGPPTRVTDYSNQELTVMTWPGKNVHHAGTFRFNRCIAEEFAFADGRVMKFEDMAKFLAPYLNLEISHKRKDEKGIYKLLRDKNGKVSIAVAYFYEGNRLIVTTLAHWNAYFEGKMTEASPTTPAAKPTPEPTPESTTPNDCLIVATEIYGRLRTSAHWVKIISFKWSVEGSTRTGHATVLYQPTPTSNVFMYDKVVGGSLDLETRSHELTEVVASLEAKSEGKLTIEEPAWVN